MSVVEFRVVSTELGYLDHPVPALVPFIDGVSLIERARAAEQRPARESGEPDLAGSYAGLLEVDVVAWPARHYLGEEPPVPGVDASGGGTVLLGCTCGHTGCWPLFARVDVEDDTVVWHTFRTGWRDRDLGRLGPFTFDRVQFETALRATAAA